MELNGTAINPPMDVVLMNRPALFCLKYGTNALVTRIAPIKFVSTMRTICSSQALEGTRHTVARIVEHHVNPAVGDDILRHALNLIGVGSIERHQFHAWDRGQLGFLFRRSHRCDHLPALAREQLGSGPAETGRTAGNDDRLL